MPRPEIIGVALLAALALVSLVERDLFIGDETKYAQVVREMHADGAVFLPTLNGEPYTHKPPLHFWLMWGFTAIGGQRAIWPYVLPAMLSGAVLVWMTGLIARKWLEPTLVWPSRFALLGLALVWGLAQTARMDLLFACLTTAGSLFLFRYFASGRMSTALASGFWFGVACLVKGPAAILIMLSIFVFESIAGRRRPRTTDLAMSGMAVLVPLSWFVPAVLTAGRSYLDEVVFRQTAERAIASSVHAQPPWFYLVAAPVIVFPWFFVLVSAIRTSRRDTAEGEELRRCVRWVLAILVPFSFISSKLPVYMVPAFPPVALLVAWYLSLPDERVSWRAFSLWGNRLLLALLVVGPLLALVSPSLPDADGGELLGVWGVRAGLVSMAAIALAGLVVGWRSVRKTSLALPLAIAIPLGTVFALGSADVNDFASSRLLVAEIEQARHPGDSVGMYYTPHLWSRSMSVELEGSRQFSVEELDRGARPEILAARSDKIDRLAGILVDYELVSSVELMGKTFNVYRTR